MKVVFDHDIHLSDTAMAKKKNKQAGEISALSMEVHNLIHF